MPVSKIRRGAASPKVGFPNANDIRVDPSTNTLRFGTGTSGTTEKQAADTTSVQTFTNKTLTTPVISAPTFNDANGIQRIIANAVAKTIVDGAATALFSVAVPALDAIGGMVAFVVRASDGTEFQVIAGILTYSAETKATVVVGTITYVAANEAKAVSSGTLTLAFTADVSVANVVTYKVQPTGSLTETAPYTIEYTVLPVRGVVTIL